MYNRERAVDYAHEWAYGRNPAYLSFNGIGGDCTNFISQCIHAGGAQMNYTKDTGWYYISSTDRAAAWTGVEYLYRFLINNKSVGPYAEEVSAREMEKGDIVQLSFIRGQFSHSLIVVETGNIPSVNNIKIATHTIDADYRDLDSYYVQDMRFLKIYAR